mmetsp:Transcript_32074/g.68341  ORF Transcript_32074/g.68341 Transcript_32074/m.68341 type:complete len:202 (-) Transcript_32074:9-614(-)
MAHNLLLVHFGDLDHLLLVNDPWHLDDLVDVLDMRHLHHVLNRVRPDSGHLLDHLLDLHARHRCHHFLDPSQATTVAPLPGPFVVFARNERPGLIVGPILARLTAVFGWVRLATPRLVVKAWLPVWVVEGFTGTECSVVPGPHRWGRCLQPVVGPHQWGLVWQPVVGPHHWGLVCWSPHAVLQVLWRAPRRHRVGSTRALA